MILLSEIDLAVNKFKVPAETIEKDYIISWILLCLSKSKLRDNFIFYGGTAIKKIYFEDHRFSEDIDLISNKRFSQEYLLLELDILRHAREKANIVLEVDSNRVIARNNRIQMFVRYSGYDEIVGVPKEVRIDFAMDMDLYGNVVDKKPIKSYSDLKILNRKLSVMTLNTILASKLGLLIELTRNEPRDLFDVWFLLKRSVEFDFDFSEVCKIFKEKYGFSISLNILLPELRKASFKKLWDERLKKQINELPNVDIVIKDVEKMLKQLFLPT